MSETHIKLLLGMVLGIDTPRSIFDKQLQIAGLTHMLVLSGSNISFLIRFFQNFIPTRNVKYLTYSTLLLIGAIPIIFGSGPSTIRAVSMAAIPLIASYYERPSQQMHLIILCGFLMAIFDPSYLTRISFQLSFAAVIGIAIFDKKEENAHKTLGKYILNTVRTTLAAQSLTTPIIFYHFGTISLVSTISNLLVSWTVPFIMLLGIPYLIIVSILPETGQYIILPIKILLQYFQTITETISSFTYSQIKY